MGLFEKKECLICGKKVGITGTKFLDGSICASTHMAQRVYV